MSKDMEILRRHPWGIALDEAVRSGKIKHGDIVVITGFGAGLTWGCDVMRWI